ncbi:MAG: hypothetical protein U0800_18485 [Isosphaeraceae bacterium]
MNELDLFVRALSRIDPADRATFLDVACAGNPELRRRLEARLAGKARTGTPIDRPTLDIDDAARTVDLPTAPGTGVRPPAEPAATADLAPADAITAGPRPPTARPSPWPRPTPTPPPRPTGPPHPRRPATAPARASARSSPADTPWWR